MSKGFRTAISLTATLFALTAGARAGDTRQSILEELKNQQPQLRDFARNQLLQGEFTNITDRKFYGFRFMAGSNGETFVERTIASGSESDNVGRSIALITPTAATHLVQELPGQTPRIWKYRPDGKGTYARLVSSMRDDLAAAAESAWSIHGFDAATLLADSRVAVFGIERSKSDTSEFVKVRFDSSAAPYPFDKGELHFRPDRSWSISLAILDFPTSNKTGVEHRETWKIRPESWPGGSVFPAEIEKTIEFVNRHDVVRTHVSFLDRSPSFDRTRLFDPEAWLAELSVPPPAPIESGVDEDAHDPAEVRRTFVRTERVSQSAARIMKFASPASGAITVLILASLFERYRNRSKPKSGWHDRHSSR